LTDESPLRIALAIGSLRRGGAETQLVGLARELHLMGHHVEVFLLAERGPLQEVLDEFAIPATCVGMTGWHRRGSVFRAIWHNMGEFRRLCMLLAAVKRGRFDVMHAFLFHTYVTLVPWAWAIRIPVRIAARRGLHTNLPKAWVVMPLSRVSTAAATAVVANSAPVAEDANLNEDVPWTKLHVIRNGLDLASSLARPEIDPPIGLFVANLIDYKGHLDLIEALRLLEPDVRGRVLIRCIGEGPMREAITAALNASDLQDRVLLEGGRPALPHYGDVQYALLTSHQEGLPNAIMEAMAAGLPVVATDVGGCRELVEDGVTGLLLPPRDPESLAKALTRIIGDVEFRVEAGRRGRERAESFTWRINVQSHLELYRAQLGRHRS